MASSEAEIAKLDISRNRAGHFPTVDAVATHGRNTSFFTTALTTTTTSIGVQLTVPLAATEAYTVRVKSETGNSFEINRNADGTTDLTSTLSEKMEAPTASSGLGASLEKLSSAERALLDIPNGVKVASLGKGVLSEVGIEKGFIITRVNKQNVNAPAEVEQIIRESDGSILIEGINVDGRRQYFAFDH